jgi:hypothetical protein
MDWWEGGTIMAQSPQIDTTNTDNTPAVDPVSDTPKSGKGVYRFQNKKTGEWLNFKWSGDEPPTSEDIKAIKLHKDQESLKPLPDVNPIVKVGGAIADLLWSPSETVAPKPLPQEEVQKLPLASRAARIGRSAASGILDPEILAVTAGAVASTPFTGGASDMALPAYYASKMIPNEPRLIKEHLQNPTLESGSNLILNTLGIAGGLHGAAIGAQGAIPPLRPGTTTETGGLPVKTNEPAPFIKPPQRQLGPSTPPVITSPNEFIDVPFTDKSGPRAQLGEGQNLLPRKTEQPVRGQGFTMGAPRVILPTTERPYEVQSPQSMESATDKVSYGPNDRLVSEPTGFTTNQIKPIIDTTKPLTVNAPAPIAQQPKVEAPIDQSAYQVNRPIDEPAKAAAYNRRTEDRIIRDLPNPDAAPETTNEQPLTNSWLRNQETDALKIMQKGQSQNTVLGQEINQVLDERGYGTQKPKVSLPQPTVPKINLKDQLKAANERVKGQPESDDIEANDDEYMTRLARHQIDSRTQIPKNSDLVDTVTMGQKLGKSKNDIVQDLVDSNIPERKAFKAADVVFGSEGTLNIGFDPTALFRKAKTFRIKDAASSDRPATYEEIKDDSSDLKNTISAWLDPLPRAIKKFSNGSPAGDELARLVQVERTERNRLNGVYSDAVIKGGVSSDRNFGTNNLTDEEFGNYRVKDSKGNILTVRPDGSAGGNESKLVAYDAQGNINAAPGYQMVPPVPGNVWDVIENNALPASDRIKIAADKIKVVLSEIGDRATKSGAGMRIGESGIVPFQKMSEGYMPHKYSQQFWDSLPDDKDPTLNENLLQAIVDRSKDKDGKPTMTKSEAQAYIRQSRKQGEILSAPQHARLSQYQGYIRDRSALFNHIQELTGRIGTAETLGPKDINGPLLSGLIDKIQQDGGDPKYVRAFVNRIVGRDEAGLFRSNESGLYRAISSVMTAKYLPFFAISDLATLGNIAMRGSIDRVIPAMWRNLTVQDRMRNNIMPSGALSEHLTNDLAPESLFGKLYKVREVESFLRGTAADVGRGTAQDLLEYIKANSKDPTSYSYKTAYGRLKNLTLKNDLQMHQLIDKGNLTNKEINFAGGRMAEMTQGLVDPVDMPYQWSNKNGGLVMDFVFTYKRFAYQSTKLLFESIKENPAKTIPLLLTMAPAIGEALGDTKSAIKGALASLLTNEGTADAMIREIESRGQHPTNFSKSHPLVSRYLDDLGQSWAFGLMSDAMNAASEGGSNMLEFATGPFISMLADIAGHVATIRNDLSRNPTIDWDKVEKDFGKFGSSLIPGSLGSSINKSNNSQKGPTIRLPGRISRPVAVKAPTGARR